MSDTTSCPSCARELRVSPHHHGRMVRCPACSTTFGIPSVGSDAPEVSQAIQTAPAAAPPPALSPPRPGPRRVVPSGAEIEFQAEVRYDPEGRVRGKWQARLGEGGLRLRQNEAKLVVIPGAGAEYRKNNVLAVELGGRRVEFALVRRGWYQARLARDVAAFLNGDRDGLDPADYPVSRWLFAVALLPLGIPVLTQGGALWGGLGGGLAGLCLTLIMIDKLSVPLRVAACLGVAAAGYAVLFVFHPTLGFAPPARLDPRPKTPVAEPGPAQPPPHVAPGALPRCRLLGQLEAPSVQCVAVSPDGRLLATAHEQPELRGTAVRFWDADTGRPAGDTGPARLATRRLAFSRDGRVLAAVGDSNTLHLWDVQTRTVSRELATGLSRFRAVALSADGKRLAATNSDRALVFNLGSGEKEIDLDFSGPPAPFGIYNNVAFSPDDRRLAVGQLRQVRVIDLETGKETRIRGLSVGTLAFTADGKYLIAGDASQTVTVYDAQTLAPVKEWRAKGTILTLAVSPDSRTLALATTQEDSVGHRRVVLIDLARFEPVREAPLRPGTIALSLAFAPDGRRLYGAGIHVVHVWELDR